MKVLVTYGGTKEPIDNIRFIGNHSSGKTGHSIASYFQQQGAELFCLVADGSTKIEGVKHTSFFSFEDLEQRLFDLISRESFALVIHAAAVSDYRVRQPIGANLVGGKISSGQTVSLTLEPTPKLINKIKDISKNKDVLLVGFKLTESANKQEKADAVERVFQSGADLVVQNDLKDISGEKHICYIYAKTGLLKISRTKTELAEALFEHVKELI